ncbi:hypothetical protein EW093_01830 [Thiospirochaeta perfilievii]|uniref:Glucosamine/galactosamine-6-phosphate isomerase domain-containing protein n=1 Tax=Thiospirochaeta perfilievii TaxID=252967 RepID=A0A5C1QA20_9SPIO|nr:6-phosphogluconolactonase [Thiospirochaeta perfilievii]QEN03494.1 hypothetical protein EW093_01830 [Thiospirochaeta perfilievii]
MELSYNKNIKIEAFDSLNTLSKDLVNLLKPGNIALSGGSTYLKLLKEWSTLNLDLDGITFFPVDERVVDFNSEDSNWGNTTRNFLSKFSILPTNHFIDPKEYQVRLSNISMDLVFLGVGDDGHTASLFSTDVVFAHPYKKVISTISPKEPKNRISLTGNYLVESNNIIIILFGDGKKDIVNKVLNNIELPITTLLKRVKNGTIYIHKPLIGDIHE